MVSFVTSVTKLFDLIFRLKGIKRRGGVDRDGVLPLNYSGGREYQYW